MPAGRSRFCPAKSAGTLICVSIPQRKTQIAVTPFDTPDARLYRLMVKQLTQTALFIVDLAGKIVTWNAGVETILGYTEEDFVGLRLASLFSDDEQKNGVPDSEIQTAMKEGSATIHAIRQRRKDGCYIYTSCVFTVVREPSGAPLGVSVQLQDVTALKASDDQCASEAASLQQSNEDLTRFGQALAHDLRAPLRMVGSYVQLLDSELSGRLDGTSHECMTHVLLGIGHMDRLITSLLKYAQADNIPLASAEVDLEEVLQETLAILELEIRENAAIVTHDLLPSIQGDSVLLRELFQNLIANALKYRGEDSPRIHVSAEETSGRWTISVRDNGIGIDPVHSAKIFLPLTRLHGPQISGSGIGLAVCKRIVERHGGVIWVESAAGTGSTFRFSLPQTAFSTKFSSTRTRGLYTVN